MTNHTSFFDAVIANGARGHRVDCWRGYFELHEWLRCAVRSLFRREAWNFQDRYPFTPLGTIKEYSYGK